MKSTEEIEEIKGELNYENLLSRAVDRCLFYRTTDPYGQFLDSVKALETALVNLPGKKLRDEMDSFLQTIQGYKEFKRNDEGIEIFSTVFKKITDILAKHSMLFRSTIVEVGRE